MQWLRLFLSDCLEKTVMPSVWKQARVPAILQQKKVETDQTSYRPISFLCIAYRLREGLILSYINEIVELHLSFEQEGFRRQDLTTDQDALLSNSIKQALQRKEKYGLELIDLSAAYDTVWRRCLYFNPLKVIPYLR